jgi:hypothetical protein
MSDESGRKGTGRMKPGNLTHSRSKNELGELPERQYGAKHQSFLRAFLWCVLNFIVYFVPVFVPHELHSLLQTAAKPYPNVTAFRAPPFPFFFLFKYFLFVSIHATILYRSGCPRSHPFLLSFFPPESLVRLRGADSSFT